METISTLENLGGSDGAEKNFHVYIVSEGIVLFDPPKLHESFSKAAALHLALQLFNLFGFSDEEWLAGLKRLRNPK